MVTEFISGSRPTRSSVRKHDPGHFAFTRNPGCKVLLDGVELRACITADEVEGFALVYATDAEGKKIRVRDHMQEEVVRGKIEIVWPDSGGACGSK